MTHYVQSVEKRSRSLFAPFISMHIFTSSHPPRTHTHTHTSPNHSTDASGYAYFCDSVVWKVATGNANGPSSTTPPSEINDVSLSDACNDGVVGKDGIGYWVLWRAPLRVAKTNGNAGNEDMVCAMYACSNAVAKLCVRVIVMLTPSPHLFCVQTLVGEYAVPGGGSQAGNSIALDETTNMLYVGGGTMIYKLDAGGPNQPPLKLQELALIAADGIKITGMTLETAKGYGTARRAREPRSPETDTGAGNYGTDPYCSMQLLMTDPNTHIHKKGYAGTNIGSYSVIKFALGAGSGKEFGSTTLGLANESSNGRTHNPI